jgi:uncharacterized protein YjiS (DUF1127 family)
MTTATLIAPALNPIYTVSFFANPITWIATAQRRMNDRRRLENATDNELDDMGIKRSQIANRFT